MDPKQDIEDVCNQLEEYFRSVTYAIPDVVEDGEVACIYTEDSHPPRNWVIELYWDDAGWRVGESEFGPPLSTVGVLMFMVREIAAELDKR